MGMRSTCIIAFVLFVFRHSAAGQTVDSVYFNLYTDSLKKGTYNYINVEARMSDGRYLPLGEKEVRLTASAGSFSGNSLFIDSSFTGQKVTVKAVLRSNNSFAREITIYIKKFEDNRPLPTVDEILGRPSTSKPSRRGSRRS